MADQKNENETLNQELQRAIDIDKNQKWMVVYSYGQDDEGGGRILLNDSQADTLRKAYEIARKTGAPQAIELKDRRILTTNFKALLPNPEWRDPKEVKAKQIFFRLQRDFMERRQRGENITWEDYKKTKHPDIKKEYDEFLEILKK